jgi:cation transport ATPase
MVYPIDQLWAYHIYRALSLAELISLVSSAVVQFWCARGFFRSAVQGLMHGNFNMGLLVSLGSLTAWYTCVLLRGVVGCVGVKSVQLILVTNTRN